MKRFLLAALLVAAFSFPAGAQSLFESTILKPLTPAHRLGFGISSVSITSKFMADTEAVKILCTAICFIQTAISGTTPVAATGGVTASTPFAANVPEMIQVPRNGKVAVIGLAAGGVLYIQEMGR